MIDPEHRRKIHIGLHEQLTAALLLCDEEVFNKCPFEILQNINEVLKKDVIVNKFALPCIFSESCYIILAQAISAAKFIKSNICI